MLLQPFPFSLSIISYLFCMRFGFFQPLCCIVFTRVFLYYHAQIINYHAQIILYQTQIILYHAQIIQLYTYQNNAERLRKESEYGENEMQYVCFSSSLPMSYGRLWVVYTIVQGVSHDVLLMCESRGRLACFEAQSIKNPAPQLWNGKSYL